MIVCGQLQMRWYLFNDRIYVFYINTYMYTLVIFSSLFISKLLFYWSTSILSIEEQLTGSFVMFYSSKTLQEVDIIL